MTDSRSMFRTWWRDRVDYGWLVETLRSHGALGRFKFMLGAGGIVMLLIAILAAIAQDEAMGPVQGIAEATVAGIWTVRWWFLPWPRETESLVWIALFDLDAAANNVLVHDRVIGVLGIVLLMAMGGYVTVFHGPRILALHVGWSLLASIMLAVMIATGLLPQAESTGHGRESIAMGLSIVLVLFVVMGVILPFVQFCNWILRVDALTDPLTMLLNRRGLDSYLTARLGRCRDRTIYIAMLDLDRFKTVNDTFGHSFGDEVLARTAQCLRTAVDFDALIARTGGEEFVIVGYLRGEIADVGEQLRRSIEAMPGLPVTVTASIGITTIDTADDPFTELTYHRLLRAADSAMYRAKRLGGNTVVFAGATGHPKAVSIRVPPAGPVPILLDRPPTP